MTPAITPISDPHQEKPCRAPGNPNPGRKDISPYWSDFTAAASNHLWLPTLTEQPTQDPEHHRGIPGKHATASWFSTTLISAPSGNTKRIFPPSATLYLKDCTACANTETQSLKIRVYPNREQRKIIRLWFDAARWCYNATVARLKQTGEPANWMKIKTSIINAVPERLKETPYQVKSVAVRDACKAMSAVKRRNKELGPGLPPDQYHQLGFRSRKNPKQGCFIPGKAVKHHGIYEKKLGKMHLSELLPPNHGDSRLTLHNGQYHLVVTTPAEQRQGETQARVVALDPGIRSFLTWFSESNAGHIAPGAFGKIQRLCAHLDKLLSRAKEEKRRLAKRNKYQAADRMRVHIVNLIAELHHQAARWLVDNFEVILLPTFETSDMTKRGARKLRAKSVRSLLTYAHYRFQKFLIWKAWQTGKDAILVNEAYTSKTCSWSGEIIENLGGRRIVAGIDGMRVDRDINGARGIFLRALGDTPALHEFVQGRIGNDAVSVC